MCCSNFFSPLPFLIRVNVYFSLLVHLESEHTKKGGEN